MFAADCLMKRAAFMTDMSWDAGVTYLAVNVVMAAN